MKTSSNGSIFCVTGHLCGEFTGEFSAHRPMTRSFGVLYVCLSKRLSKQSWGWWYETLSRPLWRHCIEDSEDVGPTYINVCCRGWGEVPKIVTVPILLPWKVCVYGCVQNNNKTQHGTIHFHYITNIMNWYRIQHSNSKCETEVFGLRVDTTQVIVGIMTMTSDDPHQVSNHRSFECLFNSFKEKSRASNAEKSSLMRTLLCSFWEISLLSFEAQGPWPYLNVALFILHRLKVDIYIYIIYIYIYVCVCDWSFTCNITWDCNVIQKKVYSFHFKDYYASLLRNLSVDFINSSWQ